MKVIEQSATHEILIGNDALSLFQWYNVDYMHGLDSQSCQQRIEEGGTYIDGLANFIPISEGRYDFNRWFVFFNLKAFNNDYRDITLIMHELTHIGFMLHEWDAMHEESIITFGEEQTNRLYPIIKQYINEIR